MTASACTEGTQVNADDNSSATGSVVSTSTPKKTYLLTEKQRTAADKVLLELYAQMEPVHATQADAAATEGLKDFRGH